jgi:hypothetical protein
LDKDTFIPDKSDSTYLPSVSSNHSSQISRRKSSIFSNTKNQFKSPLAETSASNLSTKSAANQSKNSNLTSKLVLKKAKTQLTIVKNPPLDRKLTKEPTQINLNRATYAINVKEMQPDFPTLPVLNNQINVAQNANILPSGPYATFAHRQLSTLNINYSSNRLSHLLQLRNAANSNNLNGSSTNNTIFNTNYSNTTNLTGSDLVRKNVLLYGGDSMSKLLSKSYILGKLHKGRPNVDMQESIAPFIRSHTYINNPGEYLNQMTKISK